MYLKRSFEVCRTSSTGDWECLTWDERQVGSTPNPLFYLNRYSFYTLSKIFSSYKLRFSQGFLWPNAGFSVAFGEISGRVFSLESYNIKQPTSEYPIGEESLK